MPLRAVYGRLAADGVHSPFDGAKIPAARGCRTRIADPGEAVRLIGALPASDRPIWAAAMYSGLRLGELLALTWDDVDLATGVIYVRRSWDYRTRTEGPPKSAAGVRRVPLVAVLRDVLIEHKMNVSDSGLVFAGGSSGRLDHSSLRQRAKRTWQGAGMEPSDCMSAATRSPR
jgi:integrase